MLPWMVKIIGIYVGKERKTVNAINVAKEKKTMLTDFAFWSYVTLLIVSFGTSGMYFWWLIWVIKKNKHLPADNQRAISTPYICDMLIYFGIFVSCSLAFCARVFRLTEKLEMLSYLSDSWVWELRMWPIILPLAVVGWRAFSRIRRSLPRD